MSLLLTTRRWLSNQPIEWTGFHALSAAPSEAPCLPLRGGVSLLCGEGGGGEAINERKAEAGDEGVSRLEDLQAFRCQGGRGMGLTAAVAVLLHEALRQADLLEGMPFIFFWLWAVRRERRSPVCPT